MKTKYIITTIAVIALIALYFFFNKSAAEPASTTQAPVVSPEVIAVIHVKDRKIVEGPDTIKAIEGQTITMKITMDEADEIHVHGIDKSIELEANKEGVLSFVADKANRYEFEMEHAKKDLGVIEVQPK